jgi:hypothetical protein
MRKKNSKAKKRDDISQLPFTKLDPAEMITMLRAAWL